MVAKFVVSFPTLKADVFLSYSFFNADSFTYPVSRSIPDPMANPSMIGKPSTFESYFFSVTSNFFLLR